MRTILFLCVILVTGCRDYIPSNYVKVAWEVTYTNNVKERIMASQQAKIKETGCFVTGRHVIRCDVRSARRIPLHVVEKDGVMYELD